MESPTFTPVVASADLEPFLERKVAHAKRHG